MPGSRSCGERAASSRALAALTLAALTLVVQDRAGGEESAAPRAGAPARAIATSSASALPERRVATRFDQASLTRDLPSSRNVFSLLETVEPMAISDRIGGAGLSLAEPPRLSLRGMSWTQNRILLDGADVTDPLLGGTPLLIPDSDGVQALEVTSILAPVEQPGPGATFALALREPSGSWQGTLQAHGLGSRLQAQPPANPPAIARFGSLVDASAVLGGPLAGDSLQLLATGRFSRVVWYERGEPVRLEDRLASGLARLAYRPSRRQLLRWLGSLQGLTRPLPRPAGAEAARRARTTTLGTNLSWSYAGVRAGAEVHAGYWRGASQARAAATTGAQPIDRVFDGPVPSFVVARGGRRSVLSGSACLTLAGAAIGSSSHAPRLGLSLLRSSSLERAGEGVTLAETVAGVAARAWDYGWRGPDSRRQTLELALWLADRLRWGDRLAVEPGLRIEKVSGRAEGAARGAGWTTVVPRVSARLRLSDVGELALFGGWGLYHQRLLLQDLAFGDPNAASASVYRWTDVNGDGRYEASERGPLVARAGPGSPDGNLSTVDPALAAPRARELVIGIEAAPAGWRLRLTGVDRREDHLLESVNVGAPATAYDVRYLPDPGGDILGPQDDQLLPVFDRRPDSFGADRYLLTNVAGHGSRHQDLELRVEKTLGQRFLLRVGATASRTETEGAYAGFRVGENDQGLPGELYDDPNVDTYARGRSFFDRAFTIKIAAAWRAPRDWRLGLVVRYQDGQPFARVVVVPDLAQGAEAVPATPRGQTGPLGAVDPQGRPLTAEGHRFSYTLTVDARLEKGLRIGGLRLALVAEGFNLLGMRNEVEEDPVWGPSFRQPTAVQPPRAVRLGALLDF